MCRATLMSRWSAVLMFVPLLVRSDAHAAVVSTFDSAPDGWRVVSYPFRSHSSTPATTNAGFDASGGNPPGSIRIGDVYGETGVAAPAQYLMNAQVYYGGTLAYDIFLRYTDNVTYPAIVLNAGTRSLYYDTPSPPVNAWSHRVIPLTEAGWRVSGSHAPATPADLVSALANLQGLYIYTEWHTGADDTNVDNVLLAAGPCDFIPDFDHDCDVDAHDFVIFRSCETGPAVAYALNSVTPPCALLPGAGGYLAADFDTDADVDMEDFGVFQACYSGEDQPADPDCAD